MDRTKEFLSIVEHIEIPQDSFIDPDFFTSLRKIEEEIDLTLASLSKLTSYELFKTPGLISRATDLLKQYKGHQISIDGASMDCQDMLTNFNSMRNTRYLKYMLRLKEIKRRLQKAEPELQNTVHTTAGNGAGANMVALSIEQERQQESEFMEDRRRIVKSISEIGQIIEDISLHVKLQEEQLKRVDDIVLDSDKWSKKALSELNEIWFNVKSNRKTMLKFFIFWAIVILFFWCLRKL